MLKSVMYGLWKQKLHGTIQIWLLFRDTLMYTNAPYNNDDRCSNSIGSMHFYLLFSTFWKYIFRPNILLSAEILFDECVQYIVLHVYRYYMYIQIYIITQFKFSTSFYA